MTKYYKRTLFPAEIKTCKRITKPLLQRFCSRGRFILFRRVSVLRTHRIPARRMRLRLGIKEELSVKNLADHVHRAA